MNRIAGQRIANSAQAAKNPVDLVTALALAAGAGGVTVTGLASLIDLFTGDARINNSGEYSANAAIGAIPVATGLAGVTAGALADPVAAKQVAVLADLARLEEAGAQMGRDLAMRSQAGGPAPNAAIGQQAVNRLNNSKQELAAAVLKAVRGKNLNAEQVMRRANRALAVGSGLGAAAGSVPALMLMKDEPNQTA
tara:strand:- start:161 stop:745 length:585 start_codon:yes stop_codon:yes gene_type:complete